MSMATNCNNCKWQRLKYDEKMRRKMGVSIEVVDAECVKCFQAFKTACSKKTQTCLTCAWKDRNLPYEARTKRCKACAELFAATSDHDCTKCPWNDPKRHMPSDANAAHCKACIGFVDGSSAMNCETCGWKKTPESVRRPHCMKCSCRFVSNSKVRTSTNELSNKGQTFISYDNHNTAMVDDRDVVDEMDGTYTDSLKSSDAPDDYDINSDDEAVDKGEYERSTRSSGEPEHPIHSLAKKANLGDNEYAERCYERMKRFLYEFSQLTDMQALLFQSELKGEEKRTFAKNHNISDTAVNMLHKQLLFRSEVFKEFILLSKGTIQGTRGRKSKDGKSMDRVPKKTKKVVYVGVFQPSLLFV